MKKLLLPILLISFFVFSSNFEAQAQSFRIGGGVGNTFADINLKNATDDVELSDNALAWKVYAGIGKKFLSIEGGYRSLGNIKGKDGANTIESKITGWDVALRGKIQIGPIFGYAKAGAFWSKSENSGGYEDEKSTDFLWGVGAGIILAERLELKLEWEAMNLSSDRHLSTLGITAGLYIGGGDDK